MDVIICASASWEPISELKSISNFNIMPDFLGSSPNSWIAGLYLPSQQEAAVVRSLRVEASQGYMVRLCLTKGKQ